MPTTSYRLAVRRRSRGVGRARYPAELRSDDAGNCARKVTASRIAVEAVDYLERNRIALVKVYAHRVQGRQCGADDQRTLGKKVPWYPSCRAVVSHRLWAASPGWTCIRGDKDIRPVFVEEVQVRHQYVPRLKHVILDFDAHRQPNVDGFAHTTILSAYADGAEASDLVSGWPVSVRPHPLR